MEDPAVVTLSLLDHCDEEETENNTEDYNNVIILTEECVDANKEQLLPVVASKEEETVLQEKPSSFMAMLGAFASERGVVIPEQEESRAWGEFFSDFSNPESLQDGIERIQHNRVYYKSNYKTLLAGFTIYGIVVTPILLLLSVFVGGFAVYKRFWAPDEEESKYTIAGREIIINDKRRIMAVVTICLLSAVLSGYAFVLIPTTLCWFLVCAIHLVSKGTKEEELFEP